MQWGRDMDTMRGKKGWWMGLIDWAKKIGLKKPRQGKEGLWMENIKEGKRVGRWDKLGTEGFQEGKRGEPDKRIICGCTVKKIYEIPGFVLTKPSWDWDLVNYFRTGRVW